MIAIAIFAYTAGSLNLLLRQKKAWKAFAAKYKFKFEAGGLFQSPIIFGKVKDKVFRAMVDDSVLGTLARAGNWTTLEIFFTSPLDEGRLIMASTDFEGELESMVGVSKFHPEDLRWQKKVPLYSDVPDFFRSYLTRDKVEALVELQSVKNAGFILIIDPNEDCVVTYRTRSPVLDPRKMNEVFKLLKKVADTWDVNSSVDLGGAKIGGDLMFEDDETSKDDNEQEAKTADTTQAKKEEE